MRGINENTVKAMCEDGKVRAATYRGNGAYVRAQDEVKRERTVQGRIEYDEVTGAYQFKATPGYRNYTVIVPQ